MRTILVINAKGGCGKTTISTNLASYYASRGRKTALVDYDVQQSSLEWLEQRPEWREPIKGIAGGEQRVRIPNNIERVVLDSPARVQGRQVSDLLRRADLVLVPVLPSPIDIRAAAHFIGDLLVRGRINERQNRVAVVANRVRENTLVYVQLQKFLKSLQIPFVTTLRDTQNYIRAVERGIGIFEMAPSMVEKDLAQWRRLLRWIERKR
jgi:chromosome partitioning protein